LVIFTSRIRNLRTLHRNVFCVLGESFLVDDEGRPALGDVLIAVEVIVKHIVELLTFAELTLTKIFSRF